MKQSDEKPSPGELPDLETYLSADPEVLSGRTVFRGTRVPLEAVINNLASGVGLDEVLDEFPTLDRDDVVAVIDLLDVAIKQARAAA